ncbi:MAG: hypothetical protein KBC15_02570 [Candidatus Levybacteria bacterium]|nr:hypothetical protein [Candidatus Levybacteria bacterium]
MKKKVFLTAAALTLIGTSLAGMTGAYAQTPTTDGRTNLVKAIADKFNLKQEDVQSVFDQEHTTHMTKMKTNFETQLSADVTSGKITEAQKQLILTKRKELDAVRQEHRNDSTTLTPAERKTQMEARRTELETWAKANGIDLKYLMGGMGKRMHGHLGGPGMGAPAK